MYILCSILYLFTSYFFSIKVEDVLQKRCPITLIWNEEIGTEANMLLINEVCSLPSYINICMCTNVSIYVCTCNMYIHISLWCVCEREAIIGMLVSSLHNLKQLPENQGKDKQGELHNFLCGEGESGLAIW